MCVGSSKPPHAEVTKLTSAFFGKHRMQSVWGPNHRTPHYSLLLGDARMCPWYAQTTTHKIHKAYKCSFWEARDAQCVGSKPPHTILLTIAWGR